MNRQDIINAIATLAASQGFYGRLLDYIANDPNGDAVVDELVAQNFGDVVDMVLYLEG